MDIQMPLLDGLEATRLLRAAGYGRPVVALTANVMKADVQRYLEAVCDDVLAKPVDRARFYAVIAQRLAADQPLRASAPDADFEAEVAALRADFRARLPGQADDLWRALDSADWVRMRSLLHTLKGTAGSFGYPRLTEMAAQVKAKLVAGRGAAAAPLCEALIAQVRDAAAAA